MFSIFACYVHPGRRLSPCRRPWHVASVQKTLAVSFHSVSSPRDKPATVSNALFSIRLLVLPWGLGWEGGRGNCHIVQSGLRKG